MGNRKRMYKGTTTTSPWAAYVQRHLNALLMVCPPLVAEVRSHHIIPRSIEGVLEWTLPWGMDDGEGNVRLTVIDASEGWEKPLRVRVAVATVAKPFVLGEETRVDLPRYIEPRDTSLVTQGYGDAELAHRMAAYLVAHVHGDTDSLRQDANGYWSFTVVVAESNEDFSSRCVT
jgi:hypothetical protein